MSEHQTVLSSGQMKELAAALIEAIPADLSAEVAQNWIENKGALQRVLRDVLVPPTPAVVAFKRDMRKEGWELVEDTPAEVLPVDSLVLAPFLKEGEDFISGGEQLVIRAKEKKANLGQRQAEYLLEHQEEIPREWRQYYLVFTGTIWRDRDGHRHIPCLPWYGERWSLRFYWFDDDFRSRGRLVRPCE